MKDSGCELAVQSSQPNGADIVAVSEVDVPVAVDEAEQLAGQSQVEGQVDAQQDHGKGQVVVEQGQELKSCTEVKDARHREKGHDKDQDTRDIMEEEIDLHRGNTTLLDTEKGTAGIGEEVKGDMKGDAGMSEEDKGDVLHCGMDQADKEAKGEDVVCEAYQCDMHTANAEVAGDHVKGDADNSDVTGDMTSSSVMQTAGNADGDLIPDSIPMTQLPGDMACTGDSQASNASREVQDELRQLFAPVVGMHLDDSDDDDNADNNDDSGNIFRDEAHSHASFVSGGPLNV